MPTNRKQPALDGTALPKPPLAPTEQSILADQERFRHSIESKTNIEKASSVDTSALLQTALIAAPSMLNASLVEHLSGWVHGTPNSFSHADEIVWFISKRAQKLIDEWLMNKRLAALRPISPTGTGGIVISRVRVVHVHDSRTIKDNVTKAGVVELLGQVFAHGSPKYAPNPNYSNQLLMFDATYKAIDPAARGESPVAVLQFEGAPITHLRLETAYWMKPAKTKALEDRALLKKKNK